MNNEVQSFTTSDGIELKVVMAPTRCGRGVGIVLPKILTPHGHVSEKRKRGYAKPTPWPSNQAHRK